MSNTDSLKKLIRDMPVNTNKQKDKEVLNDVLTALDGSGCAHSGGIRRIIIRKGLTKLAAAVFVIAVMVGLFQFDGARTVFARTTRVVATGLAGLKSFIMEMRTKEPQSPSAVPPVDSNEMQAAFEGRTIKANVRTFLAEGEQSDLQDFLQTEGIEWIPAENNSNTWYVRLDPVRAARFIDLTKLAAGLKLMSSPGLMVREGQEGIIGIIAAKGQDALALALVATIPDDGDSINLSLTFLHGRSGFEMPSLRINKDDALLFRLAEKSPGQNKSGDGAQGDILVYVNTSVFLPG